MRLASALANELMPICPVGVGGQGACEHEGIFEKEKISVFRTLKDVEVRLLTLTTP